MSEPDGHIPHPNFSPGEEHVQMVESQELRDNLMQELQEKKDELRKLAESRPQANKYLYMGSSLGSTFGLLGGTIVNSLTGGENFNLLGQGMMVGMSVGTAIGGAMDRVAERGYEKMKNFVQEQHKKFTQRVWKAIPEGLRQGINKKLNESLKGNVYE